MSQPTPYSPTTNFADDEADQVSGRSTVRTAAVDTELANIATTLGQILSNMAALQRDDLLLIDSSVKLHTLSTEVLALMGSAGFTIHNPIGWLTATSYPARDMVKSGTGTYVSVVAHTSGTFATDLAAGKWVLIFDSANFVASGIAFTPTGSIAATNVQAAIAEAALEAVQKAANGSDFTNIATTRGNLSVFSKAEIQASSSIVANAAGGVDAITAAFTPTLGGWTDDQILVVECAGANATTTPTLNVDGAGAKTIVRPDGSALLIGDIPAANFRAVFVYDSTLDKVLLLNPFWSGAIPGAAGTVPTSNGLGTQPSFQSTSATTVTNRAINGCFRIDQINEGAAVTVNSAGPTQAQDQWSGFGIGAAGVFTMTREADPDYTGEFNLKIACTTADAAMAAGDLYGIHTDLEGYQVADWLIGTALAKTITVQFEVKSTLVGTYGISLINSAGNRSYVGTFTVNNANTVEAKSVTLALDQSGTWLQTNGTGLRVRICLASGTTAQGAAGAWAGSNLHTTSAQANFMAVNTNVMRLKRFQVVQAASAIPFERRSYQQELALVQRYYEKSYDQGVVAGTNTGNGQFSSYITGAAIVSLGINVPFAVPKRSTPTMTYYSVTGASGKLRDANGAVDVTANALASGNYMAAVYGTVAAGTAQLYGHLTANARLS